MGYNTWIRKIPFTVGALRRHLQVYPDDYELHFGDAAATPPLTFYRTKTRGDAMVQIEFNELIEVTTP
jgi:hypothetical protein